MELSGKKKKKKVFMISKSFAAMSLSFTCGGVSGVDNLA
jgi:hypothetical protein